MDIAKLLFWAFVAGFCERLVPQMINKTVDEAVESDEKEAEGKQDDTPEDKAANAQNKKPQLNRS